MSWRTFDNKTFDPATESIDAVFFRVGDPNGSFSKMNDIFELLVNAHNYLNENMHRIFAKYLFMCNKPAETILAYRSEEEIRTVERDYVFTRCLVMVSYPVLRRPKSIYEQPVAYCGEATYTAPDHKTTLQEVSTEIISSVRMPGEAYRVNRGDFKLLNLNLMG